MLSYLMIALFLTQPAQPEPATTPAQLDAVAAVEEIDLCGWAEQMALQPPCRRAEDCRAFQQWAQRFGRPGTMQARPPAPRVVPLGPLRAPDPPQGQQRHRGGGATCLAGR